MRFWTFHFASKVLHLKVQPECHGLKAATQQRNDSLRQRPPAALALVRYSTTITLIQEQTAWRKIDSWVAHMFHSCVRTFTDNREARSPHINDAVHSRAEMICWWKWWCSSFFAPDSRAVIPPNRSKDKKRDCFWANRYELPVAQICSMSLQLKWTVNDYRASDWCVGGRRMFKPSTWDL